MRTEAEKRSRRKYMSSPKGKAMAARSAAKYRKTEAWRQANSRGQKRYKKTLNGRLKNSELIRRYNVRHPDRYHAHNITRNAIKAGKLIRQPCEICGSPNAQAHHPDYSKPLDVRWRCLEHHLNEHNKRKVS